MAIDWKKEWDLQKRLYWYYMKLGFITIPFGFVFACSVLILKHESMPILILMLAAALFTNYKVQGMAPDK